MILIDDRVGSKELAPYIHTRSRLTRLEYADVLFIGSGPDGPTTIGIERKVIGDLVSSMRSDRLEGHQLYGLQEMQAHIYLLVEGIWRPHPQNGILEKLIGKKWAPVAIGSQTFMARDVIRFLNRLAILYGAILLPTDNMQQSGYWIDSIYGWWNKPWDKHGGPPRERAKAPPTRKMMLRKPTSFERIVTGISNLSWKTATKLERHFKTPKELANASEQELLEVKGIGKKMAETIIREMRNGIT
jgi:ERCC4-type nuclease